MAPLASSPRALRPLRRVSAVAYVRSPRAHGVPARSAWSSESSAAENAVQALPGHGPRERLRCARGVVRSACSQPDPVPCVRAAIVTSSLRPVRHFLASERFWAWLSIVTSLLAGAWFGAVSAARWIDARERDGQTVVALKTASDAQQRELDSALLRCHAAEVDSIAVARELAAQWARSRAPRARDRESAAADARAHFDRRLKEHDAPAAALRTVMESSR